MKITGFEPLLISPKDSVDALTSAFEALGFEVVHESKAAEGHACPNYIFKNADGDKIDLSPSDTLKQDMLSIRINVDDLDEAVKFFEAKGYVNPTGKVHGNGSADSCMMIAPTGLALTLVKHLK